MSKMRVALIAMGMTVMLAGEVRAQPNAAGGAPASAGSSTTMPGIGGMPLGGAGKPVDEATQERRNEVDRNYRAVKGTIPAQGGEYDPWAGMRGTEDKAQKPSKGAKTTEKKKPAVR
jgi:hypothetical protein